MKIILLSGPPGAGKDTAADILERRYYCYRTAFARPLKDAIAGLLSIQSYGELELAKRDDPRVRKLMIDLSEGVVKPIMGQEWFAHRCADGLFDNEVVGKVVVTDCGFGYEVDAFLDRMWVLYGADNISAESWPVRRQNHTYANDSRGPIYINESQGENRFIENFGDLKEFEKTVISRAKAFWGGFEK